LGPMMSESRGGRSLGALWSATVISDFTAIHG
jgi:hypothetical protein